MIVPAAVEIELGGPVNGMGERDASGSYFSLVVVYPDAEIVRCKISRGELEALHHQSGFLLQARSAAPTPIDDGAVET